jgi:putative lipase involved disintegration of autophagic bodies
MELPADKSELMTAGFLSSLLGAGCECDGYNIEIVGHSLGGAVAALLGIRVSYFLL